MAAATWRWPHNLQVIHDAIVKDFPGITIYGIGDAAHMSEHSDHNEDSRGLVHALDIMTQAYDKARGITGDKTASLILAWLLSPAVRASLQYDIHDGLEYEARFAFQAEPYSMAKTDGHYDHIHVSGLHGSVGEDAGTGTGYDVAAEQMTPPGSPLQFANTIEGFDMTADELINAFFAHKLSTGETINAWFTAHDARINVLVNKQVPELIAAAATIAAPAPAVQVAK